MPRNVWMMGLLFILGLAGGGCEDRGPQLAAVWLVAVNDRSYTVAEFNRRFEAVAAESPISEKADPVVDKEMKLRLLYQLIEELILVERAAELNLRISDQELKTANLKKSWWSRQLSLVSGKTSCACACSRKRLCR